MRGLVLTILLVAPLLALTPSAEAQGGAAVSLTVVDPARAFQPGSTSFLDAYGRYSIQSGAVGAPMVDVDGNGTECTRITFHIVQKPSWVDSAQVEPAETCVEPRMPAGDRGFSGIRVRLDVAQDAPALQRENITIEAIAHENGAIPETRGVSPAIPLRAAEVPQVNVTGPESPYIMKGGVWNVMPFTVTNEGNKATKILLNVTIRPELSEVEFPQEVELEVDERVEVLVRVRTPWTERETGTLELEATPLTTDDVGPASRLAVDVAGESAVPTPGAPLLVLIVGLAALLRRRG